MLLNQVHQNTKGLITNLQSD